MVWWLKHFLHKNKNWSSDLQNPQSSGERGGALVITAQSKLARVTSLMATSGFDGEILLQWMRWKRNWGRLLTSTSSPHRHLHTHVQTHVYMYVYDHTHTDTWKEKRNYISWLHQRPVSLWWCPLFTVLTHFFVVPNKRAYDDVTLAHKGITQPLRAVMTIY